METPQTDPGPDAATGTEIDPEVQETLDLLTAHFAQGGTLGDLRGLEPQHYEAIYSIGHNYYTLGQNDKALELFQFLVMMNPWDRRFAMALGATYQVSERYDKALGYYTMAVSLNMMDPVALFHTAECLLAMGHLEQSAEALEFVLKHATAPEHAAYRQRAEGLLPLVRQQAQAMAAAATPAAAQE